MSRCRLLLALMLLAAGLVCAGCAVDPIEKLQDQLDAQQVRERKAAVATLLTLKDERSVELLVQAMESDSDLLEDAGNALVLKGRQWEKKHPNAKKTEQNPVIEQLSATVGDMHLDPAVRAKACWTLGEIGSRRALPALKGRTTDPNSMVVRTESTTALNKLGSTGDATAMEMLEDGTLVTSYDPEKRSMVIKEEAGGPKKAGKKEAGEAKAGTEKAGAEKAGAEKTGAEKAGAEKAGSEKAGAAASKAGGTPATAPKTAAPKA